MGDYEKVQRCYATLFGRPCNREDRGENDDSIHLLELPTEILGQIFLFMDIPMLGLMAQVHQGTLRELAMGDPTWSVLAKGRFQIASAVKRPKLYGGKDWKDAYRSLHQCHRMPKCRWTNRKPIFAKGEGKTSTSSLSIWATLNHTENCRTRVLRTSTSNRTTPNPRYVEFWVCLQNVKTNGRSIRVDFSKAELRFLGGLGNLYAESCVNEELSCGYRWVTPRVLHHRKKGGSTDKATAARITDKAIWLKPMEFCMVSLPFACGQDLFETDVLARTVSLHVPFATRHWKDTSDSMTNVVMDCKMSPFELAEKDAEAQAWFVQEGVIWENYVELPGGCLILSDRDNRLTV